MRRFARGEFLFLLVAACAVQLNAQSFRTVTFTGRPDQDFGYLEMRGALYSHTNYYATYDQNYLYLAAERTAGDHFADTNHFTVYIDADPQQDPTTGNGSTTGVPWDLHTPALPISADYRICMRPTNSGESFFSSYSGGVWTTGGVNAQGWATAELSHQWLEVRVPWSDLGNPSAMYFVMYMSYPGSPGFYSVALGINSGTSISGYFGGIGTKSTSCIPLQVTNTPIVATATNVAAAGTAYANLTITGNTTSTGSFTIIDGGTLTINGGNLDASAGDVNVNGTLNLMSGNILTGSNMLTVGTSTTLGGDIQRTSGHIVGKLKRWIQGNAQNNGSRLFPIGTVANYRPVSIEFTGFVLSGGSLTTSFIVGPPGTTGLPLNDNTAVPIVTIDRVSVDGYWKCESGNGMSASIVYNATFEAGGFCCITDVTTLRLLKRTTGGSWVLDGTAVNGTGNNLVRRTNMVGFSEFGVGGNSGSNPLPVQLSSFTAGRSAGSAVRLNWQTVSEINNYGFSVQNRPGSSGEWRDVANSFVAGHGTTNEPQNYEFIHADAPNVMLHYRLRQVDLDGTIHFTEPITLSGPTGVTDQLAATEFVLKQNYPNPFNPSTEIQFTVEKTGPASLDVFDVLGRKAATLFSGVAESGRQHHVRFDGNNLSSGVYVYRLQSGNKAAIKKFLLSK